MDGQVAEKTTSGQDEHRHPLQDGHRNTFHGPCAQPASTPDLFGDGQDASPPPSPGFPDPLTTSSQTVLSEDGTDDGKGPTMSEV